MEKKSSPEIAIDEALRAGIRSANRPQPEIDVTIPIILCDPAYMARQNRVMQEDMLKLAKQWMAAHSSIREHIHLNWVSNNDQTFGWRDPRFIGLLKGQGSDKSSILSEGLWTHCSLRDPLLRPDYKARIAMISNPAIPCQPKDTHGLSEDLPVTSNQDAKMAVKTALENENYDWRTVDGIVRETGIPQEEVVDIINHLISDGVVVRSPRLDKHGRKVYTTRDHYRKIRGPLGRLISSLADRII